MARSRIFKQLLRNLRRAMWLEKNPDQESAAFERMEQSLQMSRRDFLRGGAWLGAGAAASTALGAPGDKAAKLLQGPPIAIVGAGFAGLTAAYRLSKAGVPCEIFEASERSGGRVLTKDRFNSQGMFCELGGELVDTNHEPLIRLARELGLDVEDLREGDEGRDLFFVNGQFYSDEDVVKAGQPLARWLAQALKEIRGEGDEYLPTAVKWDRTSLADFLNRARKDSPKWLIDAISAAYVGEYGLELDQQSSLNLLNMMTLNESAFSLFGESDESKRIRGGNSRLTEALLRRLEGIVPIHYGHVLQRAQPKGESLELAFGVKGKGSSLEKRAPRALFTLPFTLLRACELKKLALPQDKTQCIQKYGYGRNAKAMYGFSKRSWRDKAEGRPLSNGSIASNLKFQNVWETSRKQAGAAGILTNFVGGNAAKHVHEAERFRREMEQVFPGIAANFVEGERAVMDWPKAPWVKASYSATKVGQYLDFPNLAARAELGGKLIFAGEHTSASSSGFMNGAVESGERAASELIGENAEQRRSA